MILVAPAPGAEFVSPDGSVFRADHRQILRDVPEDHAVGLLAAGCAPVPAVIVVHTFPEPGLSAHCHACGAMIEMPEHADPWEWLRKGDLYDFVVNHVDHAENMIEGWERYPVRHRERQVEWEREWQLVSPEEGSAFVFGGIEHSPPPTAPLYAPPPESYDQRVSYRRTA